LAKCMAAIWETGNEREIRLTFGYYD